MPLSNTYVNNPLVGAAVHLRDAHRLPHAPAHGGPCREAEVERGDGDVDRVLAQARGQAREAWSGLE